MKKNVVFIVLFTMIIVFSLCACKKRDIPLPQVSPLSTTKITPTPLLLPAPTVQPTESPAKSGYTAGDFLPLSDIFIRYSSKLSAPERNVYVEFIDSKLYAVQRKILSTQGPVMEVLRYENGALMRTHYTNNIGYTYNFITTDPNDEEILLKEPIKVGNQWDIRGGTREITAIDKLIPIPIGSFSAVEISTYYNDGSRCVQYYMRSVGLIAQYDLDNKGLLTSIYEATFREKNSGFPQRIRFYFANLEKGIVTSIMREVIFSPFTDPRLRFVTELRNVSGSSGLIPLSPNVRILSVVPDFKGGVTVDFSHQLITEMDLGEDGEKLLLNALANTFGEYYQAKRVYFTIEGKGYESPYLKLPLGKYLNADIDAE